MENNELYLWYESNACWGWVKTLDDLKEKYLLQLAEPNGINCINDFLDRSYRSSYSDYEYGTRSEHPKSEYTLRFYLSQLDLLDNFLKLVNATN